MTKLAQYFIEKAQIFEGHKVFLLLKLRIYRRLSIPPSGGVNNTSNHVLRLVNSLKSLPVSEPYTWQKGRYALAFRNTDERFLVR